VKVDPANRTPLPLHRLLVVRHPQVRDFLTGEAGDLRRQHAGRRNINAERPIVERVKRYGGDALLEVSVWAVAATVHGVDGQIRDLS
jgi:hypothetical protein